MRPVIISAEVVLWHIRFRCRGGPAHRLVGLLTRRAEVASRCVGLLETLRCG